MTGASGIKIAPAKTTFSRYGETLTFTLYFPPIPQNVTKIDVIEPGESEWKWYGISTTRNTDRTSYTSNTTIDLNRYNIATENSTHTYILTKIELTDQYTKLHKTAVPKGSYTWISSSTNEYIEDASTGKRYYLNNSTIALAPNKTNLYSDEPVNFIETYPPLDKNTKYIYVNSGYSYYGNKHRIKVR